MWIKRFWVFLLVLVVFAVMLVVKMRLDANEQYSKYHDYSIRTLLGFTTLEPVEVKPEYRLIHPAKMLKQFKIVLSSYTADRLARVNTVDATILACVKMFTLTIRPDYRYNLPILSVDFIFMGPKRVFVIEVIDPAKIDDDNKRVHYDRMRVWQDTVQKFEQSAVSEWSREYLADFSIHITADKDSDGELFEIYRTFLEAYLDMAKNAQPLSEKDSARVRAGMEMYVDTLLASGGPAVDFLKKFMTQDKQREYVRSAMFGLEP